MPGSKSSKVIVKVPSEFVTARVCEVPESTGSIKKSWSELQPENKAVAVNRQAPARKRNFLFIGHSF